MDLHAGQLLSHFRVIEKIDEGGMGVVYRARDLHLDRDVALKVLSSRRELSDSAQHRFRREALALSRLNHPNIAAVFDFDTEEGIAFIAMEWIGGTTVDRAVAHGPLPEHRIIEYARQITTALDYAHREGVVHRDLKPRNLRITPEGRIKILDFGLAKLTSNSDESITDTMPGCVAGTLPYMAPELLDGEAASEGSDVYAVGAVLYEMATGRRAFPQQDSAAVVAAIHSEHPTPPRELNAALSVDLEQIILRALEKIPALRYRSAAELDADLRRLDSGLRPLPRRRWVAPRYWPWAAVVAIALVITAAWKSLDLRSPAPSHPVMKPLVTWAGAERRAQLSPDNQWVLFISDRGGSDSVWLQRLRGGEPTRVEGQQPGVMDAVWSPDGENIGVLLSKAGEASLDVVPAFGGRARASIALPSQFANASLLRWYGNHLYVEVFGGGVWRFDMNSGKSSKVVAAGQRENRRGHFDIHRDEDRVVFTERRDRQLTMWLTRISTGTAERLTGPENDSGPRFGGSGDGYVFFASDGSGQIDLWRMSLATRKREQVTFSSVAEEVASISDDLSTIIFTEKHDDAHLWEFITATGEHRQLTAESMRDDWPTAAADRVAVQRQKPLMLAGVASLLNGEIVVSSVSKQPGGTWYRVAEGGRPYFSPDGRRVAYVRSAGPGLLELRVNDVATAADWLVTGRLRSSMFYMFPRDWMRRNFGWAADGSLLYVSATTSGQDQLAVWREHAAPQTLFTAPADYSIRELEAQGDRVIFVTEPDTSGTAQVHLLDRHTLESRVIYSIQRNAMSSVWVRGRTRRGGMVVLTTVVGSDFTENATVLEVDDRGTTRLAGHFTHAFAGTSRFDPARDLIYFTGIDTQSVHNIFSFSLADGTVRAVTNNTVPGISFAGLEVDEHGNLLYVRQQVAQDLWAIEQS